MKRTHHVEIGGIRAVQPGRVVAKLPLERGESVRILNTRSEIIAAAVVGHHEDEEAENEEGGD